MTTTMTALVAVCAGGIVLLGSQRERDELWMQPDRARSNSTKRQYQEQLNTEK